MTTGRPVKSRAELIAEGLAVVAMAGLLLLAAATVVDVVLRYGFASPLRGFVDIASLSGAICLAGAMPYVLARHANIAVDALGRGLGARANRVLNVFGAIVTVGFFSVMAWQYLRFAIDLRETAQTIPVLRWPVWPWWMAVALLIVVAAAIGFATAASPSHVEETAA
jgi:TRAP-type C4-dicarboxylate transport system permease small subunit